VTVNNNANDITGRRYVTVLLHCYILLPHTPDHPSRHDRHIAAQLFDRQVPLDAVKTAFVLAISRRTFRSPDAFPLEPIRSLAYFLPVISEVQKADIDPVYIDLLKQRIETGFPDLGVPPLPTPIPW
jgi:hypothetical protein